MFKNRFILVEDHLKETHVKSSLRMTESASELMMELFQFTLIDHRLQDVNRRKTHRYKLLQAS